MIKNNKRDCQLCVMLKKCAREQKKTKRNKIKLSRY